MKQKPQSFSKRITAARKKLGITRYRAAKEWDFTQATLAGWERNLRAPRGLYRLKLEQILAKIEASP